MLIRSYMFLPYLCLRDLILQPSVCCPSFASLQCYKNRAFKAPINDLNRKVVSKIADYRPLPHCNLAPSCCCVLFRCFISIRCNLSSHWQLCDWFVTEFLYLPLVILAEARKWHDRNWFRRDVLFCTRAMGSQGPYTLDPECSSLFIHVNRLHTIGSAYLPVLILYRNAILTLDAIEREYTYWHICMALKNIKKMYANAANMR